MSFKKIVPYVLIPASVVLAGLSRASNSNASAQTTASAHTIAAMDSSANPFSAMIDIMNPEMKSQLDQMSLDKKADNLVDKYVDNMLTAQQKLKPLLGTVKYRSAVRQELPGAPVGYHCVYGQYTQLNRALRDMGDTLTIVPTDASRACIAFKSEMRKKYAAPEYQNAIHEGQMFESDSAYNVALGKYMTRRKVAQNAPDSVRNAVAAQFAAKNFSADELSAGTMLVVPRYRGSKNLFHMIMLLGRGRIENGKFVPDENGRYIYTGHNREVIGDLFNTWDVSNVFAADTRKIARTQYAAEWQRIEAMPDSALISFLERNDTTTKPCPVYSNMPRPVLLDLVRSRYFKEPAPKNIPNQNNALAYAPQQNIMLREFAQHTM